MSGRRATRSRFVHVPVPGPALMFERVQTGLEQGIVDQRQVFIQEIPDAVRIHPAPEILELVLPPCREGPAVPGWAEHLHWGLGQGHPDDEDDEFELG